MSKKVTFGAKPVEKPRMTPDEWVSEGSSPIASPPPAPVEKTKMMRFTIDIPVELHARIKSQCARNHLKMRDMILALLYDGFPDEHSTLKP
jgi:hypothetical protein